MRLRSIFTYRNDDFSIPTPSKCHVTPKIKTQRTDSTDSIEAKTGIVVSNIFMFIPIGGEMIQFETAKQKRLPTNKSRSFSLNLGVTFFGRHSPRGSMGWLYIYLSQMLNVWPIYIPTKLGSFEVNVGKYTIHWASGYVDFLMVNYS